MPCTNVSLSNCNYNSVCSVVTAGGGFPRCAIGYVCPYRYTNVWCPEIPTAFPITEYLPFRYQHQTMDGFSLITNNRPKGRQQHLPSIFPLLQFIRYFIVYTSTTVCNKQSSTVHFLCTNETNCPSSFVGGGQRVFSLGKLYELVSMAEAAALSSVYLPFSLDRAARRPAARRSRIFFRSLSIFSFTIKHLEGWTPT